jgi:SsrA-binding protein
MKKKKPEVNIQNRKARFDYEFLETYVAGMVLVGSEVKSIREGRISLVDAYCYIHEGELWLKGANITPIDENYVHEPLRLRKMLLRRQEIRKLERANVEGTTIVVTKIFSVKGRLKAEIALARGKKNYDKRQAIKERDINRELQKQL